MARRKKMSKRASRRSFRSGNKVKGRNFSSGPMRGGIRL